jgi:hypothetical protein
VNFKLDENLPTELVDDLRTAGHEADALHEEGLIGGSDNVVLDLVRGAKIASFLRWTRASLTSARIRQRLTPASFYSGPRRLVAAPPSGSCGIT